jgi:N utilization substance protein B
VATRHQAREAVVAMLYAYDIGNKDIEEFLPDILEDRKIRNKQKEFSLNLFNGVMQKLSILDEEINEHLEKWRIDKISFVDKAILRLGAYEIMFESLDSAIIINEAIELSKKLCSETSPKFINGVLDSIKTKKKR